jgi:threonine/homoserine/homoserine lactone efflux protein
VLLGILGGYLLILAVPGPNMLAVGCLAALRGLRGTLPMIAGTALGTTTLALALLLLLLGDAGRRAAELAPVGRGVAAMMLLCLAAVLHPPPGALGAAPALAARRRIDRHGIAAFLAGFWTAASNPITAAYFAAKFLGLAAGARPAAAGTLLLPGVAVLAFAYWLAVAALLARPSVQRRLRAHHRALRLVAAAALAAMAAPMIWPLLPGAAAR